MLELRLLGPVELVLDGRAVELGPAKQRTVLAAAAVDAGLPVPAGTLIDRVWDDAPPADARRALHTYVARVRRVLAQTAERQPVAMSLQRRSGGYQLVAGACLIDLHSFRALVHRARAMPPGDPGRAAVLAEALAQWRGEALSGLTGSWAIRLRDSLQQQRLTTLADWAAAELAVGRHEVVLEGLEGVVRDNPLAEPLAVALLRALHMAGRDVQALDVYAKVRRRIVEEVGAEPGAAMREVHAEILGRRPAAAELGPGAGTGSVAVAPVRINGADRGGPTTQVRPRLPAVTSPAQLPAAITGFAGRRADLDRLDALAARTAGRHPGAVFAAVWGTAGVGKTTLAVHWAHTVRERFPDGQLYANLRGFDPAAAPVKPAEVIRGFLDAFGVPAERIPTGLDAQAALYRSLVADRRLLVLLDNARDADQVRPLLPGAPGCVVLVTSRNELTGLVATDGVQPISLDLMTVAESRQLLALRIGPERVAAEPGAVDRIIERCARLPLALSIAAARAASGTHLPLEALAGELRDARAGLDTLNAGDAASDLRSVFSWSYRTLSAPAARLFRLLGLHPGPDIAVPAAASLAGVPAATARLLLAELARAHLVIPDARHRYALHDLLRGYAAELTDAVDPAREREAATRRMLDHYLAAAAAAARLFNPNRYAIDVPSPDADVTPERPSGLAGATAWLAEHRQVLVTIMGQAAAVGLDGHVWPLAWCLRDFLDRTRRWHDQLAVQHAGLAAARRQGSRGGQGDAHRSIGRTCVELGRETEAREHLRLALDHFEALADHLGQAQVHLSIGMMARRAGDDRTALRHNMRAYQLHRLAGNPAGQSNALNNLALNHLKLGDQERALHFGTRALGLIRQGGDQFSEAATWDTVGIINFRLQRYADAVECFRHALRMVRSVGDRYYEAIALGHLADALACAGHAAAADAANGEAVSLLDELDEQDAARIRLGNAE